MFLAHADERHEFENALNILLTESAVYKIGEFYSLYNNFNLAERRINGNERAAKMLQKAHRSAAIISRFPFVTGIAVSGSLSKNFADDAADIDFFVITAPGRLWVARSFLHAFKKLTFLFNRQHYFCMNYFVDEASPEIVEKNIYTATEITTLLPLTGPAVFEKFYAANSWTKYFLPNNYMRISSAREISANWFCRFTEWALGNKAGDKLDEYLMKLTVKSWASKTKRKKKNVRGVLMSLSASRHFAKPDPANFQYKLLHHYENSLSELFNQYDHSLKLTSELL